MPFALASPASNRMAAIVKAEATAISKASFLMTDSSRSIWAAAWRSARGRASRIGLALLLSGFALEARAGEPVGVALVLALDTSASVDSREFALEVDGLVQAFRDPDVVSAIENLRPLGAAVAVIQWGGPKDTKLVV